MNGAFVRDFQQPMTLLIRQLANQFNVSFNVVGEVRLPHLSRARIGKRLLAPSPAPAGRWADTGSVRLIMKSRRQLPFVPNALLRADSPSR